MKFQRSKILTIQMAFEDVYEECRSYFSAVIFSYKELKLFSNNQVSSYLTLLVGRVFYIFIAFRYSEQSNMSTRTVQRVSPIHPYCPTRSTCPNFQRKIKNPKITLKKNLKFTIFCSEIP